MEQNTMEQLMEFLKTQIGSLASERKANRKKMDAIEQKMMAKMDAMQATMDSQLEETMARLGETKASSETTESCEGKTHACPVKTEAKREPTTEEIEAVEEPQEVPEGATGEETIGAIEDRSRDLRLAVGCGGQLKTRTKHDGGSRQECAAVVGRPTRRSVPAMRRGGLCKGPGKKCLRGIGGQSKASRSGKIGRIVKRDRNLDGKRTHREVIKKSLDLKIGKLLVESSVRYRKMGDGLLWKCRPPPKRKK
jgi:hypothetical protein